MSENHRPAHDEPIYMNLKDFEDLRIEPDSNWPGTRGNSHWAGRESSVWYLSGDTDETSWTGWFKDKASMSDGEIEKFIRYARESRQLSSLEQFDTMGSPAPSDSETDTEDSAKGSESCCSGAEEDNLFSDKVGSADVDCPSEIDTAYAITPEESQLRKADEMLLLANRYDVTYCLPEPGQMVHCTSRRCQRLENVVPEGIFFAIVRHRALRSQLNPQLNQAQNVSYCLGCIKDAMIRKRDRESEPNSLALVLDGAGPDRNKILKMAERIHPPLKNRDRFFIHFPLNREPLKDPKTLTKKEELIQRHEKQYDIVRILEELEQDKIEAAKAHKEQAEYILEPDDELDLSSTEEEWYEWGREDEAEKDTELQDGNIVPLTAQDSNVINKDQEHGQENKVPLGTHGGSPPSTNAPVRKSDDLDKEDRVLLITHQLSKKTNCTTECMLCLFKDSVRFIMG